MKEYGWIYGKHGVGIRMRGIKSAVKLSFRSLSRELQETALQVNADAKNNGKAVNTG